MTRRRLLTLMGGVSGLGGCERKGGGGKAGGGTGGGSRLERPAVYVWQRQWTGAVRRAVGESGQDFGMVCCLASEREASGEWRETGLDWDALANCGAAVGLGIRVGVPKTRLKEEREELIATVDRLEQRAGVAVEEWHLDLDCPRSRLGEYLELLVLLNSGSKGRRRWVITVLPDWLKSPDFGKLVREAGEYVLQVHGLRLPAEGAVEGLMCEADEARRQVEEAGRAGVPFRVALPTYASRVFFDRAGKVLDVAAEDGAREGPAGAAGECLVRSDAGILSRLVREWHEAPPAHCRGVIWYRLPVEGDRWNWRLDGLRSVMAGRVPESDVTVRAVRNEAGYYELEAGVTGPVEARLPVRVELSGPSGGVAAWDVHGNWRGQRENGKLSLRNSGGWLFPDRTQRIGWVRWSRPGEPIIRIFR